MIGTAFTAVVTAIVTDLITPLLAAIGGKPNFGSLTFTVNHSHFLYGAFINALLSFVIIAAVIYFLIVAPVTKLTTRLIRNKVATQRDCPECLSFDPGRGHPLHVLHGGRGSRSAAATRDWSRATPGTLGSLTTGNTYRCHGIIIVGIFSVLA